MKALPVHWLSSFQGRGRFPVVQMTAGLMNNEWAFRWSHLKFIRNISFKGLLVHLNWSPGCAPSTEGKWYADNQSWHSPMSHWPASVLMPAYCFFALASQVRRTADTWTRNDRVQQAGGKKTYLEFRIQNAAPFFLIVPFSHSRT